MRDQTSYDVIRTHATNYNNNDSAWIVEKASF